MTDILEAENSYPQATFSLSNRIRRSVWGVVYTVLFRCSPRPLHEWRSLLLRCFGARIGKGVHVYPTARIWAPWNLVIDDHACLGDDVDCYSMSTVHIGEMAVVSQGTYLCTGSHDYTSANFQLYALPIDVGRKAWLCAQSFIGPGVHVGEGTVIGARSVVTKNMPEWTVCGGNPCKPIKPRKIT